MVSPWVAALTSFHNTPIFRRIWVTVAAVTVYAALVVLLDRLYFAQFESVRPEFHGFLGLILGTLLVFRTNTSYDRWWEGRKLWGQLVNDCRNLAIKVQTCVRAAEADKQHQFVMLRARLAYTIARHQLRSLDILEKLLLQVTRKNDVKGYERFRDLFEAIVAYNE